MPSISIVVPFYQSGETIDRCIASIANQSFSDWELILVDDGSTDDGSVVAKMWAEKDARITLVHQANSGRSAARNVGKDIAKGAWVAFCDADDYLLPDALQSMMDSAAPEVDVVSGNYKSQDRDVCDSNAEGIVDAKTVLDVIIKSRQDMPVELASFMDDTNCKTTWAKLYRREIASRCSFPMGMRVAEDAFFNIQVLSVAKVVACIARPVYYYDVSGEGTVRAYCPGAGKQLPAYAEYARRAFALLRSQGLCTETDEQRFIGGEYWREIVRASRYAESIGTASEDFAHLGSDLYAQNALCEYAKQKSLPKRTFILISVKMVKKGKLKPMLQIGRVVSPAKSNGLGAINNGIPVYKSNERS